MKLFTRDDDLSEMESSRPLPWPRGASRTTGHVLGLGLGLRKHVLGLDHYVPSFMYIILKVLVDTVC